MIHETTTQSSVCYCCHSTHNAVLKLKSNHHLLGLFSLLAAVSILLDKTHQIAKYPPTSSFLLCSLKQISSLLSAALCAIDRSTLTKWSPLSPTLTKTGSLSSTHQTIVNLSFSHTKRFGQTSNLPLGQKWPATMNVNWRTRTMPLYLRHDCYIACTQYLTL